MNRGSQWNKQEACFACAIRCDSLAITTAVSPLTNEFDVRNLMHGQVNVAAVNHFLYFMRL